MAGRIRGAPALKGPALASGFHDGAFTRPGTRSRLMVPLWTLTAESHYILDSVAAFSRGASGRMGAGEHLFAVAAR